VPASGGLVTDPISWLGTAFFTGMANAAGKDFYQALKSFVLNQYPQAADGVARLEKDPYSQARRDQLSATLYRLGAAADPELQRLADQLMAAVAGGGHLGSRPAGNAVHPSLLDQLARAKQEGGMRALYQTFRDHVQYVSRVRSCFPVANSGLLVTSIDRAIDIPSDVRAHVASLHAEIRRIIIQIAQSKQSDRYYQTEGAMRSLASQVQRDRGSRIVEADKAFCISADTLQLTVNSFTAISHGLITETERASSPQWQIQMMFGHAVLVHELAEFTIEFIRGFNPGGQAELQALHQEALDRIRWARADQERLERQALQPNIHPRMGDGVRQNLRGSHAALHLLEQEWQSYMTQFSQPDWRLAQAQQLLPTLELIRDEARHRLDVLEIGTVLNSLRQNDRAVRATAEALSGFIPNPLTPTRLRNLVGTLY
jgi:hypothetical protein